MSSEEIRNKLNTYLDSKGIKHRFIAKILGVSDVTVCLFLKGQRKISIDKLKVIEKLIEG